jgi:hypothetical protein
MRVLGYFGFLSEVYREAESHEFLEFFGVHPLGGFVGFPFVYLRFRERYLLLNFLHEVLS